jgi:hypothetical protein
MTNVDDCCDNEFLYLQIEDDQQAQHGLSLDHFLPENSVLDPWIPDQEQLTMVGDSESRGPPPIRLYLTHTSLLFYG